MGSCSSDTRTSSVCCLLKLLVRALAVSGLVWILLVGSPEGRGGTEATSFAVEPTREIKGTDQVAVGAEKLVHDPKLDLINYMSKRRVPNGPDPIHNRYVVSNLVSNFDA